MPTRPPPARPPPAHHAPAPQVDEADQIEFLEVQAWKVEQQKKDAEFEEWRKEAAIEEAKLLAEADAAAKREEEKREAAECLLMFDEEEAERGRLEFEKRLMENREPWMVRGQVHTTKEGEALLKMKRGGAERKVNPNGHITDRHAPTGPEVHHVYKDQYVCFCGKVHGDKKHQAVGPFLFSADRKKRPQRDKPEPDGPKPVPYVAVYKEVDLTVQLSDDFGAHVDMGFEIEGEGVEEVKVCHVAHDDDAYKQGVMEDWVIVGVDGNPVTNRAEYEYTIDLVQSQGIDPYYVKLTFRTLECLNPPGPTVKLWVGRDGKQYTLPHGHSLAGPQGENRDGGGALVVPVANHKRTAARRRRGNTACRALYEKLDRNADGVVTKKALVETVRHADEEVS